MNRDSQASGDPIPPDCEVIEVHVVELKQLFNSIDPATFREQDHPKAKETGDAARSGISGGVSETRTPAESGTFP